MSETRCKSCGALITWAVTENGKRMPIDAQKDLTGNVKLEARGRDLVAIVGKPGSGHYVSHFATCANATQHRRGKGDPGHV